MVLLYTTHYDPNYPCNMEVKAMASSRPRSQLTKTTNSKQSPERCLPRGAADLFLVDVNGFPWDDDNVYKICV